VGVTGGIGCGKSRVVRRLASRGLPVLDLDGIARELTGPRGRRFAGVVAGSAGRALLGAIDRKPWPPWSSAIPWRAHV
jgi:dephospho-CoA kinase